MKLMTQYQQKRDTITHASGHTGTCARWAWSSVICLFYFLCGLTTGPAFGAERSVPIAVKDSMGEAKTAQYVPLERAQKPWNICVSFPHLKDSYWLAVNYGIADQAQHLGVGMNLHHAGGYENLSTQIQQIQDCVAQGADGVIIGSVSLSGLNPLVKDLHQRGIPVVDLVNGISSPLVEAHSKVSYYDMGYAIGKYVNKNFALSSTQNEGQEANIAWFPGPIDAGWVKDGSRGFFRGIAKSRITLIAARHGDTGKIAQSKLVSQVLDAYPQTDIIVGTAVTAEASIHIARQRGLSNTLSILAYYFTPGVYRGIQRGQIQAAPTDSPVLQARIAMDQMVRILENKPFIKWVSPRIQLIDRDNVDTFDRSTTLAPSTFHPTFKVAPSIP